MKEMPQSPTDDLPKPQELQMALDRHLYHCSQSLVQVVPFYDMAWPQKVRTRIRQSGNVT